LTTRPKARKTGLQTKKESFAPDVRAQDQTEIKLSELRPCRIALDGQDMPMESLVAQHQRRLSRRESEDEVQRVSNVMRPALRIASLLPI
jgi:hypothetical protein